ncbi:unnamed protein product [Paramecium primaurelia]|uniref:Transmembrane protein n=1 Tax=Paramecium primaurelia TaxID=5886 RepID=A0A8S1MWM7_PARPR|nr:unnamed protein product [Paramecium primaurelia]
MFKGEYQNGQLFILGLNLMQKQYQVNVINVDLNYIALIFVNSKIMKEFLKNANPTIRLSCNQFDNNHPFKINAQRKEKIDYEIFCVICIKGYKLMDQRFIKTCPNLFLECNILMASINVKDVKWIQNLENLLYVIINIGFYHNHQSIYVQNNNTIYTVGSPEQGLFIDYFLQFNCIGFILSHKFIFEIQYERMIWQRIFSFFIYLFQYLIFIELKLLYHILFALLLFYSQIQVFNFQSKCHQNNSHNYVSIYSQI